MAENTNQQQAPQTSAQANLLRQITERFKNERHGIRALPAQFQPFDADNMINQVRLDQYRHALTNMLKREATSTLQYNQVDYLNEVHIGRISEAEREEAILTILQFSMQVKCLDQTILQAVHLADTYLRRNQNVLNPFIRVIYAVALEISIKMNEQEILSLEDMIPFFDGRFSLEMLQQLERHIFMMNQFQILPATPLDFMLHFTYTARHIFDQPMQISDSIQSQKSQPLIVLDQLIDKCLPYLHFALSQYKFSRVKYSSLSIAVICMVLQKLQHQAQSTNGRGSFFESGSSSSGTFQPAEHVGSQQNQTYIGLRDAWLQHIWNEYGQPRANQPTYINMEEIYELMTKFMHACGHNEQAFPFPDFNAVQIHQRQNNQQPFETAQNGSNLSEVDNIRSGMARMSLEQQVNARNTHQNNNSSSGGQPFPVSSTTAATTGGVNSAFSMQGNEAINQPIEEVKEVSRYSVSNQHGATDSNILDKPSPGDFEFGQNQSSQQPGNATLFASPNQTMMNAGQTQQQANDWTMQSGKTDNLTNPEMSSELLGSPTNGDCSDDSMEDMSKRPGSARSKKSPPQYGPGKVGGGGIRKRKGSPEDKDHRMKSALESYKEKARDKNHPKKKRNQDQIASLRSLGSPNNDDHDPDGKGMDPGGGGSSKLAAQRSV